MPLTCEYRPAQRRRKWRHDDYTACDLFSGFGGLTWGIRLAGFRTIVAANHNLHKVLVHEANFPEADHWIADLVDAESLYYHDVRDLPAADLLVAGISCTNHTLANSTRAYEEGLTLFDLPDQEYKQRATRSERDRATANCVLHYAQRYHPRLILVECTTELASWGRAVPGKKKVGDGSTYRWWLGQFRTEGYKYKVLYLNSMFFGVPQSRDRIYIVFWDARLPAPDLEHRPPSWCGSCSQVVEAVWSWKTGVPATGRVRYGEQYNYRCPRCRSEVFPPMTPSLNALDLTNLGTRIGDKPVRKHKDGSTGPYAAATMARAERCRQRMPEFPLVMLPAPAGGDGAASGPALATAGALLGVAGNTYERPGSDCRSRGLDRPLWAQTATNSTGLLTPPVAIAVDNYQGAPRGADEPLPTQGGSETLAVLTARVMPNRTHATSRSLAEPMETVVAGAGSGGLGLLSAPRLLRPRDTPGSDERALLSGWFKQNGKLGTETAPHPISDPLGTLTAVDTTALLFAEWREAIADTPLDDYLYKMLGPHEVGRGCGFDVDFPGYDYKGTYLVWGTARQQVDGFGNAVSPQVGQWIGSRLRPCLDRA